MPSKEEFERLKETVAGLQVSLTATIEAVRALQVLERAETQLEQRRQVPTLDGHIRLLQRVEDLERAVQQAELERAAGEILAQADEGPEPD